MKSVTGLLVIFLSCILGSVSAVQAENVPQEQLDPVPGPQLWIEEHWQIKPEKFDRFMEIYRERIYPVLRTTTGYHGYTVVTSIPSKEGLPSKTKKVWKDFTGADLVLGPPEDMFPAHSGINLRGTRTDTQVHLGSLLRGKFNVIIIHYLDNWDSFETWVPEFMQNWRDANNGQDMWDGLQDEFFTEIVINHWDTVYRMVETSFVRD